MGRRGCVTRCVTTMPRYRAAYTLFPRTTKAGTRVWYYRTYDAAGRRTTARSTGKTSKSAAREYCDALLREGRLVPSSRLTLDEYARDWWVWDRCRYIAAKRRRDPGSITEEHAQNRRTSLVNHTLPYLGKLRLDQITPEVLERWMQALREKGKAPQTINHARAGLRTMLREAVRQQLLRADPTEHVAPLPTGGGKPAGTLTPEEAAQLFTAPDAWERVWKRDALHYTINLLAATTGCRQGELLALRGEDVLPGRIVVDESRTRLGRMKETKTRQVRIVPLHPAVQESLQQLLPADPTQRIFQITGRAVTQGLYRALERADIDRASRGIKFHSWRHFYVSLLRAAGISDAMVSRSSGHATTRMLDHYTSYNASEYEPIVEAAAPVLGPQEGPQVIPGALGAARPSEPDRPQ